MNFLRRICLTTTGRFFRQTTIKFLSFSSKANATAACLTAALIVTSARAADSGDVLRCSSCLRTWAGDNPQWLFGSGGLSDAEKTHLWVSYGLLGSALVMLELAVEPPRKGRWDGENGFDEGIRSGLKGRSRSARSAASTASDALFGGLTVALVADQIMSRFDTPFLKSLLFDVSWLLNNELVTRTAKVAGGRERPYVDPCENNPHYVSECDSRRDRNASFFSGHASTTATMAGLICSRHVHSGNGSVYDWLGCAGAAATSAATGMLRITAEKHNATDVIAGWASGAIFGYVLPSYFRDRYAPANLAHSPAPIEAIAGADGFELRFRYAFR